MKILEQALNKINPIGKKQKDFFIILIKGLIGSVGKKTFRNLARYMQIAEHTFARQMIKTFDFIGLNAEMIKASKGDDDILIAAQDSSFIPKSGKSTHGIDYFWNGCAGKSEKGLELDLISVVKLGSDKKEGYTLSAQQTPADSTPKSKRKKKKMTEPTKIDFYLDHLKRVTPAIKKLSIKYITVDAFFAKTKYVSGAVELGLDVICKLRKDARLLRIYNGPQKARGRKRKTDKSKICPEDFQDSPVIEIKDEKIELRSCIAHSVSLGRSIKVVWVRRLIGTNKYGEAFLFSTDTEMDASRIYKFYVARFQIEFIFRDAKGFTGLTDCQSRDARRLYYHFNASLTALNIARIQDNQLQKNEKKFYAFSMTNWARKYHVEIVINRFIAMFELDQTSIKLHPDYDRLLEFGNIRH
jgi:hypothetical protein